MHKHIRLVFLAALVAAVAGCAALPVSDDYTGAAPNAVAATVASAEGQSIRECRWAKATGTKMRTRICYSQEEWARIDALTAQDQDTDAFFRGVRENAAQTGGSTSTAAPGP